MGDLIFAYRYDFVADDDVDSDFYLESGFKEWWTEKLKIKKQIKKTCKKFGSPISFPSVADLGKWTNIRRKYLFYKGNAKVTLFTTASLNIMLCD